MMDADFDGNRISHVNSREARARWRDLLDTIYRGSPGIVIERYGKPVAALVSYGDFERLQLGNRSSSRVAEPTAVYTTAAQTGNLMNESFNELLQALTPDAQNLVMTFARLLQQQMGATAVSSTPTVTLPVASLTTLSQLLPNGYAGDALADSESLYDDV